MESLIEELGKTLSRGRRKDIGGEPSIIPLQIKLLLGATSILLVLVLLGILPPLGDAIAIPLATLLMIAIVDYTISAGA